MKSYLLLAMLTGSIGCGGEVDSSGASDSADLRRHRHPSTAPFPVSLDAAPGATPADMATSPPPSADMATSPPPSVDPSTPPPSGPSTPTDCTQVKCWYVDKAATGANDGAAWASAWNELDQINWMTVNPGDHIEIAGGTYVKRLVISKAGTASQRIVVEHATQAGKNGKVTFDFTNTALPTNAFDGFVRVASPYVSLDGKDWGLFDVTASGGMVFVLDTQTPADSFLLKNIRVFGNANDVAAAAIYVNSGSLSVDHVWFGTQIGSEDHIKFTGGYNLSIQNSVFTPWISMNGSHSDLVEGHSWDGVHPPICGDLVFRHNLVWDSGTGGQNIVLEGENSWNTVDISYNVFKDVFQIDQGSSRGSQRISNNVFYGANVGTFGGNGTWEAKNNIFDAPASNTNLVWGTTPQYSLWAPGTYGYFAGNGNLQSDPLFLDPTNVLGADGIPFTADDGFTLRAGSPAINKGSPTIDSTDILGRPIVGAPDIGAYEFTP